MPLQFYEPLVLVLDGGTNNDGHKALDYEEFRRSLAPCGRRVCRQLAPLVMNLYTQKCIGQIHTDPSLFQALIDHYTVRP